MVDNDGCAVAPANSRWTLANHPRAVIY